MIAVADSIPEAIVREHIAKLCERMCEQDVAAVIVFDTSNMLAFTGTPHMSWDRLSCGVVTREGDGVRVLFSTGFEALLAGPETKGDAP